MKFKKAVIIIIVICCFSFLSMGCAGGFFSRLGSYYGTYVCDTNPNSFIEFTDFVITKKAGTINIINLNIPRKQIENYSKEDITLKVYRLVDRNLYFRFYVDKKAVEGKINLNTKVVTVENLVYKKIE